LSIKFFLLFSIFFLNTEISGLISTSLLSLILLLLLFFDFFIELLGKESTPFGDALKKIILNYFLINIAVIVNNY
jgi:hypothetical protein